MQKVYTETEATTLLRLTRKTLYSLRESGKLTYVRIGSRVLYRERDLEEFLESQTRPAKNPRVLGVTGQRKVG